MTISTSSMHVLIEEATLAVDGALIRLETGIGSKMLTTIAANGVVELST